MKGSVALINRKGRVIFKPSEEAVVLLQKRDEDGKNTFRMITNPDQMYYSRYDESLHAQPEHKQIVNNQVDSPLDVEIF